MPTAGFVTPATIVPLIVVVSLPPVAVCAGIETVRLAGIVGLAPFAMLAVAVPVALAGPAPVRKDRA